MSQRGPTLSRGPATPMDEAVLERLRRGFAGRLDIVRELGHGGMAVVYLADDIRHQRQVALKVLRPELGSVLGAERFLREVRIVADLQHPNIVPLFDSGEVDGFWYFIMPYVQGETLRARLRRERQLAVSDVLRIARDVAGALDYAHAKGILHRDIKPENILLTGERALVADFGIARAVTTSTSAEEITSTGVVVGTPHYMSPEQAGSMPLDGRTDVYALGCVVFEMLAGEPPFSGATAQALIARHMSEPPPSLAVVRPNLPPGVMPAVNTALAKVPADRYRSAGAFLDALERSPSPAATRPRRLGVGLAAALATGLLLWRVLPAQPLDPNRVLVFPLQDAGGARPGAGADVATYIGHVLDGSEPLKWEESGEAVPRDQERRLSQTRRAGYFIDGAIVRAPDSVTVILRLYDVAGDSMLHRAGLSGPAGASEARLGARVAAILLPTLLPTGRSVDIGALGERAPAAIANFLQGERAYRRSRFADALEHYRAAVAGDSLFAVAAMKGGQAASWLERDGEAQDLLTLALARESFLPGRYVELARGLLSYQRGDADSAVHQFQHALRMAPEWSEGYMALGEVYYHLLPMAAALDSMALLEFRQAFALDSGFSPPLYHLAEIAVRQHRLADARRFAERLRSSQPDSTIAYPLELILACAESNGRYDWTPAMGRSPDDVLEAARVLAGIPAHDPCAEDAYRAVLAEESATPARSSGAIYGLQSLLVEQTRWADLRQLLTSSAGASGPYFMVIDALAGAPFAADARRVVDAWGRRYDSLSIRQLWLASLWHAHEHEVSDLPEIVRTATAKADSSGLARDRLLAGVITAHATLAAGDSVDAMARLAALSPQGTRQEMAWYPWCSLAYERYVLMQLLAARRDRAGVLREGAVFDSPQPVAMLLYRRATLPLRIAAAESLDQPGLAERLRRQAAEIDRRRGREIARS